MMGRLYAILNALCLLLYTIGHAAVGTFFTNTRIVGLRDSPVKLPLIALGGISWPLVGAVLVLRACPEPVEGTGGAGQFLGSLARPFSWRWVWRVGFTFLGARYLLQESIRKLRPRPRPPELLSSRSREIDLHRAVAEAEGVELKGLKGLVFRANDIYRLEVTEHDLLLRRLPREFDGFTILQVSDLHYGDFSSAELVRRYAQVAIDLKPDLIALTGDYQQYRRDVRRAAKLLEPLGEWNKERCGRGVVAIMGNHDTWAGTAEVTNALRSVGITVLGNKHLKLEREGGAALYLAGVADPWSLRADLRLALLGVPEGACVVLLAHEPDFFGEAVDAGVDLQLSGHLHGGQIKLPLIGALLSPSRYNRRYIEGFYKQGHTLMYVCRGLGGHPAIRWNCKPELALFRLHGNLQ